ncbi:hypothetical protein AYI70_g4476 [Smittium culicis]|uniref:Uncharacterized protein n=1 Tax=Smittium culicis TaxID=133412 RepID=A0A1R1XYW5_9FUNG|nr:hypothetical protein AYI70_g4476 [Smittium culicis]
MKTNKRSINAQTQSPYRSNNHLQSPSIPTTKHSKSSSIPIHQSRSKSLSNKNCSYPFKDPIFSSLLEFDPTKPSLLDCIKRTKLKTRPSFNSHKSNTTSDSTILPILDIPKSPSNYNIEYDHKNSISNNNDVVGLICNSKASLALQDLDTINSSPTNLLSNQLDYPSTNLEAPPNSPASIHHYSHLIDDILCMPDFTSTSDSTSTSTSSYTLDAFSSIGLSTPPPLTQTPSDVETESLLDKLLIPSTPSDCNIDILEYLDHYDQQQFHSYPQSLNHLQYNQKNPSLLNAHQNLKLTNSLDLHHSIDKDSNLALDQNKNLSTSQTFDYTPVSQALKLQSEFYSDQNIHFSSFSNSANHSLSIDDLLLSLQ